MEEKEDDVTVDTLIEKFIIADKSALKKYSRGSEGLGINQLKKIAASFSISCSQGKPELVDCISDKLKKKAALTALESEERAQPQAPFKKDLNTVPRLLNILSEHKVDLMRSRQSASASDLTSGTHRSGNPMWVTVAEKWNDPNHNSGGLLSNHQQFTLRNINPEKIGEGKLSAILAYEIFNNCQKAYAVCYRNSSFSGCNDSDFC
jgi:hypothetical protein